MPITFTHDPIENLIILHTPDGDVWTGAAGDDPIHVAKQLTLNYHDQEARRLHAELNDYERLVMTIGIVKGEYVCLIMDDSQVAVAVKLNKRDAMIEAFDKFMRQD